MKQTYKFTIQDRLEGLNTYIEACRSNQQQGAKLKKIEQDKVILSILSQLKGLKIENPIFCTFLWYELNKRWDKDNISGFGRKVILGALVESGVLVNDTWNWIVVFQEEFAIDSKYPRIEVELREIEL